MAPANDEANLARIRDNQRRSRARRKEYQQELEQRVRSYEEQGIEASTEVQQAARHVSDENRKLRTLLRLHGVTPSDIDAYLLSGRVPASAANPVHSTTAAAAAAAATTVDGPRVQALDQLLLPRLPLQFGTASPGAGSPASSYSQETSAPLSRSVSRAAEPSPRSPLSPLASSSAAAAVRTIGSSSGPGGAVRRRQPPGGDTNNQPATALSQQQQQQQQQQSQTAVERDYAGGYSSGFLSPGPYGMAGDQSAASSTGGGGGMPFYGLEGASAEDLQYTGSPAFFDYSMSPQYLQSTGFDQPQEQSAQAGQQPAGADRMAFMRTCPACMSGLGCHVHGTF